jgi:hypothetical protein
LQFLLFNQFNPTNMFEDVFDMAILHSISPELTCTCDEFHVCQQCQETGLENKQPKFPHFCTVVYNTTISINNNLEVVTWEAFVCNNATVNGEEVYNLLPIALRCSKGVIKSHRSTEENALLQDILQLIYKDRYVVVEEHRLKLGSIA